MIYKLKRGNIVKVIAPSSYVEDEEEFLNGIEIIKNYFLANMAYYFNSYAKRCKKNI